MIPWPERMEFRRQLTAWAVRGVFCAAPSFYWATVICGRGREETAAMAAGVATYVVGFAWVTSLPGYVSRVRGTRFGSALSCAANLRAGLAPAFFFGPDWILGAVAVGTVKSMVLSPTEASAMGDGVRGFALTYATTLVQGALVSATMGVLAVPVLVVRGVWQRAAGSEVGAD
jgi:hypothetical protein